MNEPPVQMGDLVEIDPLSSFNPSDKKYELSRFHDWTRGRVVMIQAELGAFAGVGAVFGPAMLVFLILRATVDTPTKSEEAPLMAAIEL